METLINRGYKFKIVPTKKTERIFLTIIWMCKKNI